MKRLKKIGQFVLKIGFVLCATLLLFEMMYRFNWIDFYSAELNALNSQQELESPKKKLLVFGDSFTANQQSYAAIMQDSIAEFTTINSGVVGISVKQMRLFFEDRVEEFKPDAIIIQLYVGNDFQDYHHSRNWSELSFFRNMYSLVGDKLMSLQYLNYKLGGLGASNAKAKGMAESDFNPNTYNQREVRYFRADAHALNDAILVEGNQKNTYTEMKDDLLELIKEVHVPVIVLVLPHAAQITNEYRKNMVSLGAILPFQRCVGKFGFYDHLKEDLTPLKNVKVISPLLRFRIDGHRKKLYYPNDPHLTEYGQKRVFDFVYSNLKGSF